MQLAYTFKHLISEYYSKDLSEKSKSAKYQKMQAGEYQSMICHYGYRKGRNNRLEIDEDAAAVVHMIFDLSLNGLNAQQIVQELYQKGIPTPGEYKALKSMNYHDVSRCHNLWQRSTVLRILVDERYAGTYIIGKRAVKEVGGSESQKASHIPASHVILSWDCGIPLVFLTRCVYADSRRFYQHDFDTGLSYPPELGRTRACPFA